MSRGIRFQRLWRRHGDAVPFAAISEGFPLRGARIPFFSTFEGVDEAELRLPDREELRPDPELVELRWERAREG